MDELCRAFWTEQMKMVNHYMQKVEEVMKERDNAYKEAFLLKEKLLLMSNIREEHDKIRYSIVDFEKNKVPTHEEKGLKHGHLSSDPNPKKEKMNQGKEESSTNKLLISTDYTKKRIHRDPSLEKQDQNKDVVIYSKPKAAPLIKKKEIILVESPTNNDDILLQSETKFVKIAPRPSLKKDDLNFYDTWRSSNPQERKLSNRLSEKKLEISGLENKEEIKPKVNEEELQLTPQILNMRKVEKAISQKHQNLEQLEEFLLAGKEESGNFSRKSSTEKIKLQSPKKLAEMSLHIEEKMIELNKSLVQTEIVEDQILKSPYKEPKEDPKTSLDKSDEENKVIILKKNTSEINFDFKPVGNKLNITKKQSFKGDRKFLPLALRSFNEMKNPPIEKKASLSPLTVKRLATETRYQGNNNLEVIKETNTVDSSQITSNNDPLFSEKQSEFPSSKINENEITDLQVKLGSQTTQTNNLGSLTDKVVSIKSSPNEEDTSQRRLYSNQNISYNLKMTPMREVDIISPDVANQFEKKLIMKEKEEKSIKNYRTSYK